MRYDALLEGRTALVTGGAQGIGRAIALLFAQQGATVAIADVVDDKGLETERELCQIAPGSFYMTCDAGNIDQVAALCARVDERFGKLDILINNVGINLHTGERPQGFVYNIKQEYYDRVLEVNLRSAFLLCKHFLPGMAARGWGRVQFTSTIHSVATVPHFCAYNASKGAINALSRALAAEYGPLGVRVNTVSPGGIRSSIWEIYKQGMSDFQLEMASFSGGDPLRRMGISPDIAYAHLFFASDMARAVTGEALLVDGGAYSYLHVTDTIPHPDEYPISHRLPRVLGGQRRRETKAMDVYGKLGVKKLINAWDTMSLIGGSRMEQRTLDAMREASHDFVELRELQQRVGERLAQLTRNEAAYVTAGASSGILISCAVCMAGGADPEKLRQLPDTQGLRDHIVVMKGHRNAYDFAIKASGATLVEAGEEKSCTREQLIEVIDERTAAVVYFQTHNFDAQGLPLEEVVEIAHARGVYVIVDGAAQLPPVENLWHYTRDCGADIALFSGGKGLRGPQQGGLAVGKKELIDGFLLIGPPNAGIARSSKVGKEEIVGVYTAVQTFLEPGYVEGKQRYLREASASIIARLEASGYFTCHVIVPGPTGQTYDWVMARINDDRFTGQALAQALREGEPGIMVGAREEGITVNPLNLEPEEVDLVVYEIIRRARDLAGA